MMTSRIHILTKVKLVLTLGAISWLPLKAYECNSATTERDGFTFEYTFNCEGGPCECGQFATGDHWVVSENSGVVRITAISPTGESNGAMVNPDLIPDASAASGYADEQKQGLIMGYNHYDAGLNLMTQLPYDAKGGESILKVKTQTSGCGTRAIETGCVSSGAVLTVLDEVPENGGSDLFRPPFHGSWKPLYSTTKVKMERLPSLANAEYRASSAELGDLGFEEWLVPQYDLNHMPGFSGEFHRATIPHASHTPYAADQALNFLEDLTRLFGTETIEQKRMGAYSLIQRGIDNYAIFKMNIRFSSGAGQHLGKKPPITFFAAMYDDTTLLNEVRSIATDEFYESRSYFQEDSQIRAGKSGMPIWGSRGEEKPDHWYWSRLYPRLDTKGASGDPQQWIDGPAGGIYPDENETRDRNYISVSAGPIIGYAFLQHLMPWYKYAAGDPEVLKWSDRIYKGYGIPNFDGGLWTLPDPCAPVAQVDINGCNPYKLYSTGVTGCEEYQITWGPNPDDENNCIEHGGDPNIQGRMPELHGYKISLNRIPTVANNNWDDLRECADPDKASYPCPGLGPEVDLEGTVPENTDLTRPSLVDFRVMASDNHLTLHNTAMEFVSGTLTIFNSSGVIQKRESFSANAPTVSILDLKSGVYFYSIELTHTYEKPRQVVGSFSKM